MLSDLYIFFQSCENAIICWKPGRLEDTELRPGDNSVTIVHRFDYKECEIWFIRFAVDYSQRVKFFLHFIIDLHISSQIIHVKCL